MIKRLIWLVAIVVLLAIACSPQSSSTPTTTAPDTLAAPTATSPPLPSAEAGPTTPTVAPPEQPAREQVVQIQPGDWVRGPETAAVTFIEWGDFQ